MIAADGQEDAIGGLHVRVLLMGIPLMRTGEIEANLVTLNEDFQLPDGPELIARKLEGPEKDGSSTVRNPENPENPEAAIFRSWIEAFLTTSLFLTFPDFRSRTVEGPCQRSLRGGRL